MRQQPKGTGPVVLCVEDEPSLRADIVEELEGAGYRAIAAGSGPAALKRIGEIRPDIILCDIMLPGLHGYQVLEEVRGRRRDLADVPFIFLTALGSRDDLISGKRAAVDDYLTKPIDFDLMLASIEACLTRTRAVRSKVEQDLRSVRAGMSGLRKPDLLAPAGAMKNALDLLALGIVLVDEKGAVLFANDAARRLTLAKDGVSADRTLRVAGRSAAKRVADILRTVSAAASEGEEDIRGLSLERPEAGRDILLVASALARDPSGPDGPTAVVFLSDPERRLDVTEDVVASLFGLTSTESKVAIALAGGCRRDEIARRFDISQTTVAFHMRNLFQKTATHRQTDLIALILVGLMAISPEPSGN